MNAKNFSERLDFVISRFGNIGDMVKAANLSYTTISRWKEGSDPKMSNLITLSKVADINLHWLLTGEGTPDNSPAPVEHKASTNADADQYIYIPYFPNIVASAGGGRLNDEGQAREHLAFRKDWIESSALNANNLVAIKATGDSMVPTIPENTTILIDKSKDNAVDGRIYVVRVDEQLFIKRVQRLPTGGIRLISDNAIYAPMDLSKADLEQSDIKVYGQVVHLSYLLPH